MVKKKNGNIDSIKSSTEYTKKWNREIGYSWKNLEPHEDAIKDLGQRLREWALKEDSLRLTDFLDEQNVPTSTYYTWLPKFEYLRECQEFALRRLASRRYHQVWNGKGKFDLFRLDQHLYDTTWGKQVNEYHADLRNKDNDKQVPVTINMIASPETEKVKEWKERAKSRNSDTSE